MGLRVFCDPAKTSLICDLGQVGRKCTVESGDRFVLEAVASGPPPGGYSAFRLLIRYSANLNLVERSNGFASIKSPRCELPVELTSPGRYRFACKAVPFFSGQRTTYNGGLVNLEFICKGGEGQVDIIGGPAGSIYTQPGSVQPVGVPLISQSKGGLYVADSVHINCNGQRFLGLNSVDTDGDGCSDARENGLNAASGGLRDFTNQWDFYDVTGPGGGSPDGYVDLSNDVLGVLLHYSPTGGGSYDASFDRGPTVGPNPWNLTAPDGVIDLGNDILGAIMQLGHDCRG